MSDDPKPPKLEKTPSMLHSSMMFKFMLLELLFTALNAGILSLTTSLNGITSWDDFAGPQKLVAIITCVGAISLVMKAFFSNAVASFKDSKDETIKESAATLTLPPTP